jgi:hypothetical protein
VWQARVPTDYHDLRVMTADVSMLTIVPAQTSLARPAPAATTASRIGRSASWHLHGVEASNTLRKWMETMRETGFPTRFGFFS